MHHERNSKHSYRVIDLTDRDGSPRRHPEPLQGPARAAVGSVTCCLAHRPPRRPGEVPRQLLALPVPRRKATTVPTLTSPYFPHLPGGAASEAVHWMELPARHADVAEARRVMGETLRTWRVPEDVCQDAVLILSELVTNAIRHTSSTRIHCCVGLAADGSVHLEVHDQATTPRSLPPCEPGLDDECGRGLLLVQHIAERWGAERSSFTGGNAVWAALASPSTSPLASPPASAGTTDTGP